MNNLYILLTIAGVILVAGVIGQGVWQARKASRMLQGGVDLNAAPNTDKQDFEPTWQEGDAQEQGGEEVEASLAFEGRSPFYDTLGLPDAQFYTSLVDPLIDAVVLIELDHHIKGETALAATPPTRRVGSKPIHFEGFNNQSKSWEPLNRDVVYKRLQCALQMANRTGALNEIEFSDFIRLMHNYADALNGAFEAPDMAETVARARELDQFACDHDAQLSIYLVSSNAAWSPSYLQQQACALGFVVASVPGRMMIPSMQTGAPPVLTLSYDMQAAMANDPNMMPITHATLTLDVPQTDREEQPFKLLYKVAATLSKHLEAAVVDDQGVPLDAQAFDAIYNMLEGLYDQLEQRGLNAGSNAARRLFS